MLILIASVDEELGIGKDGALPWKLSADLAHFKEVTMGHRVIMGSKTAKSLGGRPLPGRENIVFSSHGYRPQGFSVCTSLGDYFARYSQNDPQALTYVIGGEQLFKLFMPFADRLHITHVETVADCDRHFPYIDPMQWLPSKPIYSHEADEKNDHRFDVRIYIPRREIT